MKSIALLLIASLLSQSALGAGEVKFTNGLVANTGRFGTFGIVDSKAVIEMASTTKGFLPPRMTTTQKNAISSPTTGLVLYDSSLNQLQIYTGSAWTAAGAGGISYAADTGSANAYAIAPSTPAIAYNAGDMYAFKVANANTTSSTLNVSSLGTKNIKTPQIANLPANALLANAIAIVVYDGTQFQLVNQQDPTRVSPLSSKGQIHAFSTVDAPLSPGTDGQVVTYDSSTSTGLNTINNGSLYSGGSNLILNNSFENGTTGWMASGGTFARTTTAGQFVPPGIAGAHWASNAASQTLCSAATTITANDGISGSNGAASINLRCSSGTCTHLLYAYDGTNILASTTVTSSTTSFARSTVNYINPASGTVQLCLKSVAVSEPDLFIDDGFLGRADNFNLSQMSQAQMVGSVVITACAAAWTTTTSAGFVDPAAQASCTYTATGQASAPSTNLPAIKFANGLPPGEYKIEYEGAAGNLTGGKSGYFQFTDGTNAARETSNIESSAGNVFTSSINQSITYTSAQSGPVTLKLQMKTDASGTAEVIGVTGAPSTIRVYRFPTQQQQGYSPDQTPASWSGYHDTTCLWSRNATSLADPVADASCALVERQNRNFGTVSTYGSVLPGITFNPPRSGRYFVCAISSPYNNTTGGVTSLRLTDGTTTIADGTSANSGLAGATGIVIPVALCGIYNATSTASVSIRIQAAASGSSTATIGGAGGAAGSVVEWSIFQLDTPMPVPFIQGQISSNTPGQERIERVTVADSCTSSPCTVASQTGTWIPASGVTRSLTGHYSISFSGAFSAAPACVCTPAKAGTRLRCFTAGLPTSSSWTFEVDDSTNTDVDSGFSIICMGPH